MEKEEEKEVHVGEDVAEEGYKVEKEDEIWRGG